MTEINDFPHTCHYRYRARVIRWVDGDTVVLDIDLGFEHWMHGKHIRIARVDTPEVRGAEKVEGKRVAAAVRERIPEGSTVMIETLKDMQGKFGRFVAEVFHDGENLSDWLLANGYAEEIKY